MSKKELTSLVRRLAFVKLALKCQESMTALCRKFGISRKNGYKWKSRFEKEGAGGLQDRSRRPHRSPQKLPVEWVKRIRSLRRRHRTWGSRKLAARLKAQYPRQPVPSARTIGQWLKRLNLNRRAVRRSRRGPPLKRTELTQARWSNHVWTVDFKGWFRTEDGARMEPLTVRDLFSRYLLEIRLLPDQSWEPVQRIFKRLFARYGYPKVIRSDNGGPFGSSGPAGLSRLSAWWIALKIRVEFISPGHPEENGAHEQMHRVYKAETTRPRSGHREGQQRRSDRWVKTYNQVRPHESLKQRPPAAVYRPGRQERRAIKISYPSSWAVRWVRSNGQIKWKGHKRFIGEAFVGYPVALKPQEAQKYTVYYCRQGIGELWESDAGGIRPSRYMRRR